MATNKNLLDELIVTKKYTANEIAKKVGVSDRTVTRRIKVLGLGKGQGVKNFWIFTEMTPELAYVIGAFITDGSIGHRHITREIQSVIFSVTSKEFVDRYKKSIISCGLKIGEGEIQPTGISKKVIYRINCYSSMFARWLAEITDNKNKIPDEIINSSHECRIAFLEGVIDGDGRVRKAGNIEVRKSKGWINQLREFVENLGIGSRQRIESYLHEDVPYISVSIRRSDFVKNNPHLAIPEKMERILNGRETRIR